MSDAKYTVCGVHGRRGVGLVCIHVGLAIDSKEQVGFYWRDHSDTARPDAWCADCEAKLLAAESDAGDQWFRDAQFKVLCTECWDEAKALLHRPPDVPAATRWGRALRVWWESLVADVARPAWPRVHPDVITRSKALLATSPSPRFVVALHAHYLPHGGQDALSFAFFDDYACIERTRTPLKEAPFARQSRLDRHGAQALEDALLALGAWTLGDHHEPIRDGLIVSFALARADKLRTFVLHCGTHDSPQAQLFDRLIAAAPAPETVQATFRSSGTQPSARAANDGP